MKTCDIPNLSAYVDGELNAASRQRVDAHIIQCLDCSRELRELQELSSAVANYAFADIDPHELSRVHDAINADESEPIWRLGGVLGALAASVLIVSGVWLAQISKSSPQTARTLTPPQNWERIAVNLRVDPFPVSQQEPTIFAKADLAELMLEGLEGGQR